MLLAHGMCSLRDVISSCQVPIVMPPTKLVQVRRDLPRGFKTHKLTNKNTPIS